MELAKTIDVSSTYEAAATAENAFVCLSKGLTAKAGEIWLSAALNREAGLDSSLIDAWNGAVGMILLGREFEDIQKLLDHAEAMTISIVDGLQNGTADLPSTSSSHHFRLAAHNHDVFAKAVARRQLLQCSMMRELIAFHRRLSRRAVVDAQTCELARKQLALYFGERSPEVTLITTDDADAIAECFRLKAVKLRYLLNAHDEGHRPMAELVPAALGLLTPNLLSASPLKRV